MNFEGSKGKNPYIITILSLEIVFILANSVYHEVSQPISRHALFVTESSDSQERFTVKPV